MFKKILVPLDGSSFAEAAIPLAREIAECAGGEIVLLRVDEPYEPPPGIFVPVSAVPETLQLSAGEYLEQWETRLRLAGFVVSSAVLDGRVSEALLKFARDEGADLIVMCTHGRTGLSRLLMGSVAEQVVHRAPCPVLLIRPPSEA